MGGALATGGSSGFAGMALGIAGGTFGIVGLSLCTQLMARAASGAAESKTGAAISILMFLGKIPVYVGLGFLANRLGKAAFTSFLIGIILVYFVAVVWAAMRSE